MTSWLASRSSGVVEVTVTTSGSSRSNHVADAFINVRSVRPHLIVRTRCQGDRRPGRESHGHEREATDRAGLSGGGCGRRRVGCDGRTDGRT